MKQFIGRLVTSCLFIFLSTSSLADEFFDNLHIDTTIPEACRDANIDQFRHNKQIQYFTTSINGAKKRGFTYEYPMSRHGATLIWKALKDTSSLPALEAEYSREPSLQTNYELLKQYGPLMGLTFGNEGEVLEGLVLLQLKAYYDSNIYYFTGGVEYHQANGGRPIGELDLIVGEKNGCKVVAIGEAKLGVGSLSKAKSQLQRFASFLQSHSFH